MDQDSKKNQTQTPASSTGPIPSGVGVMPSSDTTATPTTPATTPESSTINQQPTSEGGSLSMGFSMNPPTSMQEPASSSTTTPPSTSTMDPSQSPLQIDNQESPKSDPLIPTESPPPTDPGYTQTKSHRMMYIFIFLSIIIVVSLIVLFFYRQYMNFTGQSEETPTISPQITKVISPTAIPTLTPVNEEEADLQKINIEEIDKELQDIETDVNQLNASPTTIR